METQDFFLLNDQDNYKIHETLVIMSNNIYSNIISQINMNYLLIIFTIGCVTSLFLCSKKDKEYIMIAH
jgi:hypothetical protein